jgi:hypothetical protein
MRASLNSATGGRFVSPFPRLNVNGFTSDLINNELLNAAKTSLIRPKTVRILI